MKKTNQFITKPKLQIRQTAVPVQSVTEKSEPNMRIAFLAALMETISRRTMAIVCFVAGALFGLVVLGWYVWPVEWTGGSYTDLTPADKGLLIEVATNLNVYNPDDETLIQLRQRWPEIDELACHLASKQQTTQEQEIKLTYFAYRINQRGCDEQ